MKSEPAIRTRVVIASAPDASKARLLEPLAGVADIALSADPAELKALLPGAEVLVVGLLHEERVLGDVWPYARNVRWVHSLSAGVEGILLPDLVRSAVVLTNARGVFRRPLAEFALLGMLMHFRQARTLIARQRERRWSASEVEMLRDKVMGVVGYGEIGRECALLAHALGMRIHALRRNPARSAGDPIVERAFAPRELLQMLGGIDVLVCAAPLTSATHHLISAAAFAAMKREAFIINVGRGPVIDEAQLARALREERIAGAALDVFEQEPLPAESPLWDMDNVLLSPHSADNTVAPDSLQLTIDCFIRNLHRFRNGEPLENVVDKHEGY
ncbi:MAG: D-2-hydroxyacid dehydrogenase [Gammaproteobacteria bacterium]|nr:D-2-hydroxyacid dehydrogenase [Gammaproteobacteria bacterium]MDE2251142.1 D-2-hydroxyacid dehydrogenase [Gammaproteobacteria bacterium]